MKDRRIDVSELPQDGWAMAVRACRVAIEHGITPSPERERLLRHLDPNASPLSKEARDVEALAMRTVVAKNVAARLWSALRRWEPDYLDMLISSEREDFNAILGRTR